MLLLLLFFLIFFVYVFICLRLYLLCCCGFCCYFTQCCLSSWWVSGIVIFKWFSFRKQISCLPKSEMLVCCEGVLLIVLVSFLCVGFFVFVFSLQINEVKISVRHSVAFLAARESVKQKQCRKMLENLIRTFDYLLRRILNNERWQVKREVEK